MIVHHVSCGTLCPPGSRWFHGRGSLFERAELVCHCWIVETPRDGLVVVDTGLGAADVVAPSRLPLSFRLTSRPRLDPSETLVGRLRALGHAPRDVRHIAVTHLDVDHAGGIGDFPGAAVHVHRRERDAALGRRSDSRYGGRGFGSHESWHLYDDGEGETWKGLAALRPLRGVSADIGLVPLPGHTLGHAGVALRLGERWLLHAGDAYLRSADLDTSRPSRPLDLLERTLAADDRARRANRQRLAALRADPSQGVTVVCSHDPDDLPEGMRRVAESLPETRRER